MQNNSHMWGLGQFNAGMGRQNMCYHKRAINVFELIYKSSCVYD